MKGILPDSEQWRFYVQGDWRQTTEEKHPDLTTYTADTTKGDGRFIWFGGGIGFYWFLKGDFANAIRAWKDEVETIEQLEQEEGEQRYHKGWFYYMIGESYRCSGDAEAATSYFAKAKEEDRLSYGEKAKDFPNADRIE